MQDTATTNSELKAKILVDSTKISIMLYEMMLFVAGIALGLTILPRAGVFALTGGITCITMLPMYPLVRAISKIGGESWRD